MKLLLNPSGMIQLGYTPPPLGLLYLAAMNPETIIYDAALYDNDGKNFINSCHNLELVGVPLYTMNRQQGIEILRYAKEKGAITVAGGPHVSVATKQLADNYPFIDYLVTGDGEYIWKELCENPKSIKERIIKTSAVPLDDLPIPAWNKINIWDCPARTDKVKMHRGNNLEILPRISIVLGRGCNGACTFCSTWWVHGKYRAHSQEWMGRQLKLLWGMGVRHLVFQDDCLTVDKNAVLGLCDELDKYNFSFFGTTRVDCLDEEIVQRLKNCGCYELSFGIESGSETILKKMNKHIMMEQSYTARELCRKYGIIFTALLVAGFPGENGKTIAETNFLVNKLQPDSIGCLGHTMVFPGTAIYQWCKKAGLVNDDFWLGNEPYYVYRGGL